MRKSVIICAFALAAMLIGWVVWHLQHPVSQAELAGTFSCTLGGTSVTVALSPDGTYQQTVRGPARIAVAAGKWQYDSREDELELKDAIFLELGTGSAIVPTTTRGIWLLPVGRSGGRPALGVNEDLGLSMVRQ